MNPALRESAASALTLLIFSVVASALLAAAYIATRPAIERSEQAEKMTRLAQILPAGYTNDPVREARPLPADPLLGLKRPGLAYPARRGAEPIGIVLEARAPDGYAGEIRLLVGIHADGRVAGVRVTTHRETPGLGDYIEIAKSPWINQFVGKHLGAPPLEAWKVRKDGGQFDYISGATITPRAVVNAVREALRYYAAHKAELLLTGSVHPTGARP